MVLARVSTRLKKRFSPLSKRGSRALSAGEGELATSTRHVPEIDEQEAKVEPHRLSMRKTPGERAEPREGEGGLVLVVQADGGGSQGLGVVRGSLSCREERALGGDRSHD